MNIVMSLLPLVMSGIPEIIELVEQAKRDSDRRRGSGGRMSDAEFTARSLAKEVVKYGPKFDVDKAIAGVNAKVINRRNNKGGE